MNFRPIFWASLVSLIMFNQGLLAQDAQTPEQQQEAIDAFYPVMLSALRDGRLAAARELCEVAIEAQPEKGIHYYNLACVEARSGNQDKALVALRKAADFGFEKAKVMSEDTDMDTLRDHPTYKALFAQISKNAEGFGGELPGGKTFTFKGNGGTQTITLPKGWDWSDTSDDVIQDEVEKVLFIASTPADHDMCIVKQIMTSDSEPRLTVKKIEKEFMESLVLGGEGNGTLKRGKVTLFGKEAHAVLADYQQYIIGVESPKNMVLKIVSFEPTKGAYDSLYLRIVGPSLLTEKSPQELANFLMGKQ